MFTGKVAVVAGSTSGVGLGIVTALGQREGADQEAAARELLDEKRPLLQFVTPVQLGDMVVFLTSEAAAQMTGMTLLMDDGWTALRVVWTAGSV